MAYQIGDFARMAQISHKQLKYYEQCELIVPSHIDEGTGYRYYEAEQLGTVANVRAFMSMGFSTTEIKALLEGGDYATAFEQKQKELEAGIEEYQRKLKLLSFYRDAIQDDGFHQQYRATIKVTECGIAAVRRKSFQNVNDLILEWQNFYDEVQYAEAVATNDLFGLTRFYSQEFEWRNFDAELILYLKKTGKESSTFAYQKVEPIRAVSVIHHGRYELLVEAYAFAYMWINRNGYKVSGKPMESYLCGPSKQVGDEALITELYIPIE